MHFAKFHSFRTGVCLEISGAAIQTLIEDAAEGRRLLELSQIERPDDIFRYLTVAVRSGASDLMARRERWAGSVRNDILGGRSVQYHRFANLFWRDIDEADPDGDEWHGSLSNGSLGAQIVALLDQVRSAQRAIRRSADVSIRMHLAMLEGKRMASGRGARQVLPGRENRAADHCAS